MNFDRVFEVLKALEREQVRYVFVGGVALNLHGPARDFPRNAGTHT